MNGPVDPAQVVFRSNLVPLGAILAGGASRRFGSPKALAPVGGVGLAERVRAAIRAAGLEPRLITGDATLVAALDLPSRTDSALGGGPLAGIQAALRWAAAEGRPGALCVSCDLPFLEPELLRTLCQLDPYRVVVPESTGPAGIEPLCAFYPVGCLEAINQRIERGALRLQDLLAAVPVRRMPLADVRRWGDPGRIFFNVNSRGDHQHAEAIARG